jgi:hypothetical protein
MQGQECAAVFGRVTDQPGGRRAWQGGAGSMTFGALSPPQPFPWLEVSIFLSAGRTQVVLEQNGSEWAAPHVAGGLASLIGSIKCQSCGHQNPPEHFLLGVEPPTREVEGQYANERGATQGCGSSVWPLLKRLFDMKL